jgi:putative FmdB family regulatory protein
MIMPIYEYKCGACKNEFEILVLPGSPTAQCPKCHSQDIEQLLSAFAVNSEAQSKAAWKSARKAYKKGEWKDKKVAEAEEVKHHLDHGDG